MALNKCVSLSAIAIIIGFLTGGALMSEQLNPLSNGGFEELSENGFPRDWSGYAAGGDLGKDIFIEPSQEAHSGKYSLRMKVTATGTAGLNRAYIPGRPEAGLGSLLPKLKGGFTFWYKVISAGEDNVRFYVIPMKADNLEGGDSRATYIIPKLYAGDGKWHLGAISYDYTDKPEVNSVQVAPRINEGGKPQPSEILFDDIQYVEKVGAHLKPLKIDLIEDEIAPGERGILTCTLENSGDQIATNLTSQLNLPEGLKVNKEQSIETAEKLKPGEKLEFQWLIEGKRESEAIFEIKLKAAGVPEVALNYKIAPELKLVSFGPTRSVIEEGQKAEVKAILENIGHANVIGDRTTFGLGFTPDFKIIEPPEKMSEKLEMELVEKPETTGIKAGQKVLYIWRFKPMAPQEARPIWLFDVTSKNAPEVHGEIELLITAPVPKPEGIPKTARAYKIGEDLLLENQNLRLVFVHNPYGYGIFAIDSCDGKTWTRMAMCPYLGRLWYQSNNGKQVRQEIYAHSYKIISPEGAKIEFYTQYKDVDSVNWNFTFGFELKDKAQQVTTYYKLTTDKPRNLLAFHSPRLYVGEGSFGSKKDAALLPGIFYLLKDETSIDTTFAAPPFNDQHVPHPYKITIPLMALVKDKHLIGLMWDPLQKWDGENICPSALFASHNWLEGQDNHLLGLFLPSIPQWVNENEEIARKPYELQANEPLELKAWIIGGYPKDIVDAPDYYFAQFGIPELPEKPRSYEETIKICGGKPIPHRYGRLAGYLSGSEQATREDLETQAPDGSWRFKMDENNTRLLKQYTEFKYGDTLGPEGDTTVGTCTFIGRRTTGLLRYARISANQIALEAGMKGLKFIDENFIRPEGAQTWEVPLHCPDVLAAHNAIITYLEAYKITGEKKYLEKAIFWAKTGLPFIYMWNAPDRPTMMRFASIPVLGVSFYSAACWFGTPVQWNGLAYAYALMKLSEYDKSFPWKHIAEGITICGMQMQNETGDRIGKYPDSVNLIAYHKSDPGICGPGDILRNVYTLRGDAHDPDDFNTFVVKTKQGNLHINAEVPIQKVQLDEKSNLRFSLKSPYFSTEIISSYVIIAALQKPAAVYKNNRKLDPMPTKAEEWWRYDERRGGIVIMKIKLDAPEVQLTIKSVKAKLNRELLKPALPDWQFNIPGDPEGWTEANHLESFYVSDGTLKTKSTGPDPYMFGPPIKVEADKFKHISIRMKTSAGAVGQIFWITTQDPAWNEDKSMHFPLGPYNQFVTYHIPVGDSPLWKGTISQIRLDPGSGENIQIEIDWIKILEQPAK